jgi:ubiquinone/menaquinone biosynthesis C-methylase UbiE
VLEVGCGPGHLSILLACDHGMDVTAIDLDPAMIERGHANADRAGHGDARQPSFLVGDVASLPFADESFDLVVSTLSMHHWAEPPAGLREIARVLRPGARALIWDFRRGFIPLHAGMPDPLEHTHASPLRLLSTRPWRWPWRLKLIQRIELMRANHDSASSEEGDTDG